METNNGEIVRFIEFICFDKRLVEDNSAERILHFKDAAIIDGDVAMNLYHDGRNNADVQEKVYQKYIIRFTENGERKNAVFCVNFDDMRFAVPIIDAVIADKVNRQIEASQAHIKYLQDRISSLEAALYRKESSLWRRIKNAVFAYQDDKKWFARFLQKIQVKQ